MFRHAVSAFLFAAFAAGAIGADLAGPQGPEGGNDKIAVSVLPTGPKYSQVITVTRLKKDKSEVLLEALLENVLSDRKMEFSDGSKGRIVEVPKLGELGISMWEHIPSGFKFPDGHECTAFGDCPIALPKKILEEHPHWADRVALMQCKPAWRHDNPEGTEAEWRASDAKWGGHNFDILSVTLSRKRYNSVGATGSNFCVFRYVSKSQVKTCAGTAKLDGQEDGEDESGDSKDPAKASKPSQTPQASQEPKDGRSNGKRSSSSNSSMDGSINLRK